MKKNRVKILVIVYVFVLSSLALGWYPEERNCYIAGTAADRQPLYSGRKPESFSAGSEGHGSG